MSNVCQAFLLILVVFVVTSFAQDPTPDPNPSPSPSVTPSVTPNPSPSTPTPKPNNSWGWEGWLVFSVVLIVIFFVGVLFCFFGYKFFKFLVALFGFFLVAILTFVLVMMIADISTDDVPPYVTYIALGIAILFGIVGAIVAFWFYLVGVFMIGAVTGAFITWVIYAALYVKLFSAGSVWPSIMFWITLVILVLLCGLLAIKLQKIMIIIGSALAGGFMMTLPFIEIVINPNMLGQYSFGQWAYWQYIYVPAAIALGAAGIIVQLFFTSMNAWHEENDEYEKATLR